MKHCITEEMYNERYRFFGGSYHAAWDDTSLVFVEKEYTNTWIKKNANRLGNGLKDLGTKKGDRVVVCLMNTPEVMITFQAIFRIGAFIVPIIFSMDSEETEFIL